MVILEVGKEEDENSEQQPVAIVYSQLIKRKNQVKRQLRRAHLGSEKNPKIIPHESLGLDCGELTLQRIIRNNRVSTISECILTAGCDTKRGKGLNVSIRERDGQREICSKSGCTRVQGCTLGGATRKASNDKNTDFTRIM